MFCGIPPGMLEDVVPGAIQDFVVGFNRCRHGNLDDVQSAELSVHSVRDLTGQRHQTLDRLRIPKRYYYFRFTHFVLRLGWK
jgi:hypothetical protein